MPCWQTPDVWGLWGVAASVAVTRSLTLFAENGEGSLDSFERPQPRNLPQQASLRGLSEAPFQSRMYSEYELLIIRKQEAARSRTPPSTRSPHGGQCWVGGQSRPAGFYSDRAVQPPFNFSSVTPYCVPLCQTKASWRRPLLRQLVHRAVCAYLYQIWWCSPPAGALPSRLRAHLSQHTISRKPPNTVNQR